jgi:hypothetical protein
MAGIGGFKGGAAGVKLALKNNEMYIANLKAGLKDVPRNVLGALAASALEMAIKETKHDSSRFAANWDISVGGVGLRGNMAQRDYGESGERFGSIGEKNSKGDHYNAVQKAKSLYYGYTTGPEVGVNLLTPNGMLWDALKMGRKAGVGSPPGAIPRVELFNPITSADYGRPDGAGHTYAFNALKGGGQSQMMAGAQSVADRVGNAMVPMEILRITKMLKTLHVSGGI